MPRTSRGIRDEDDASGTPSCPVALAPQQSTRPASSAHTWVRPTARRLALRSGAESAVSMTGDAVCVGATDAVPRPSSPLKLVPQQ